MKGFLDLYATYGVLDNHKVPVEKNKRDYFGMLKEMEKVLAHSYHGPKLEAMRRKWVQDER